MKRVAIFVILAALTVGFSSCSAVRHCQAPEVEMPGQIASGYTDSLTIADLSWWQFYGDSTLRRVIELTLENNKDMLAAAARVEQMRQLYRISKAERLPNFSARGLADYETNDYADEEIEAAIKPNTKLFFGETIANPALTVFDIERFANIAHRHNLPLIIDNTFATPILCRPIEFGADIVIHSTSKYMDGHAVQNGGVIVDSGKFDWTKGSFPGSALPTNRITESHTPTPTEKPRTSSRRECS